MTEANVGKRSVDVALDSIKKHLVDQKPQQKPDLHHQVAWACFDVELAEMSQAIFAGTEFDFPLRKKERIDHLVARRDALIKEYRDSQDNLRGIE